MVNDLTSLVGHTPILELSGLEGLQARLAVKIEFFNPGGSVKDRIALAMITDAEERGLLTPGATIIEPTSGNTGVGLAWVGAVRGYRVILTMPDTMSVERRNLLKAYGAQLELTPGAEGMRGAIARAEQLRDEIPGAVILGQFTNPANPAIHRLTTGRHSKHISPPWRSSQSNPPVLRFSLPVRPASIRSKVSVQVLCPRPTTPRQWTAS